MTEVTKKFIEDQITVIESGNYKELFQLWYDEYGGPTEQDWNNLNDLFKSFKEVGIYLDVDSKQARYEIILDYMIMYIRDQQFLNEEYVTLAGAVNSLFSRLHFGLIDLKKIFEDAVAQCGLKMTTGTGLRAKL